MNYNKLRVQTIYLILTAVLLAGCESRQAEQVPTEVRPKTTINKSGTLTQNETWSGEVFVADHIVVPDKLTLSIEPGTVVRFKHYRGYKETWKRIGISVEGGTLKAVGTLEKQIWFTSDADDPINGDWSGISLTNSITSEIDYVITEFGEMGMEQFDSEVMISNSIIRWNNAEGVYAERSRLIIKNNTFYGNGYHDIALEQYSHGVRILNNIFRNGNRSVHLEKSSAYLEGNYFKNYKDEAVTAGMESNITVKRNKFENIGYNPPIRVSGRSVSKIEDNDYGNGHVLIPKFDYKDIRHKELGYIPGRPEDKYLYIYDEEDETRRVVKKIGQTLLFGWALVYTENHLWRFSLGYGCIGKSLDFIKIDPATGAYQKYGNNKIINPRGLAYDGEYFWVNDFSLLKIFKFALDGDFIRVLQTFDIPQKDKGGTGGLATDGDFLYLVSKDGLSIYKIDKNGNVVDDIRLEISIGHELVWTGEYFWATGGKGLCKLTKNGGLAGEIYPAANGTWALAWDGNCLWTIQRTCEMWDDPKIYQIEILDDSLK